MALYTNVHMSVFSSIDNPSSLASIFNLGPHEISDPAPPAATHTQLLPLHTGIAFVMSQRAYKIDCCSIFFFKNYSKKKKSSRMTLFIFS